MNKKNRFNKQGQITVFVIVAIVIVLSLSLIFISNRKAPSEISASEDPKGYMQKCIKDALTSAEEQVIPHGGFAAPKGGTKFNSIDIIWMCYDGGEETLCTNKHPMLKAEIQKEITNLIKPKIEVCFNDVALQLKNYNYKEQNSNISTEIILDKVEALVKKKIEYTKNEITITLYNFDTTISSPLYTFAKLSTEISNQEVSCNCPNEACNADIINLNRFNRDFEIKRFVSGDTQKVYSIKEILSGKEFNIAVRNCVTLPPSI